MPKRIKLEQLSRSSTAPHRLVERAKMILLACEGEPIRQIADKLDRSVPTIYFRLKRFNQEV